MQKILTVVTALIEILCTGAIINGWAAMDYILTKEGYFSSDCNNTIENHTSIASELCPSQQYNLELVYTLSVVLSAMLMLIGGSILDRYGTMLNRNVATAFFVTSCIAIAFSNPDISWILYPAFIVLASSGLFLYITGAQTANFFPKFRGTIINILNGAVGTSLVIFSVAKAAYDSGISLRAIFLFFAFIMGVFLTFRSFFLMPKDIIPYVVPDNYSYGISEYFTTRNAPLATRPTEQRPLLKKKKKPNKDIESVNTTEDAAPEPSTPLKSSLLNSLYILGAFSMIMQWFRTSFYVEELNGWLKYLIPNKPHLVSFDISVFGYIQMAALVFAPLNGAIYDLSFYLFQKSDKLSETQAKLRSLVIVCLIASFSSILFSIFALIDSPSLQYVSFLLYVFGDTFPEANMFLLLIQFFPMRQFGTLFGIGGVISGLAIALQYPLFFVAIHYFNGNFLVVNIISLILITMTLAHPANMYRKSR